MKLIKQNDVLQAHPEFLNEQIDDHDKAVYAKGWNACNSAFYGAIKELPTISPDEDNVMATEYIKRDEALSFPLANGKYDHEHANEHFIYGLETYKEWLEQLPVVIPSNKEDAE